MGFLDKVKKIAKKGVRVATVPHGTGAKIAKKVLK